jgi:hypothetical protein
MASIGPIKLRGFLAALLLQPMAAAAFEITYDGEFITEGLQPQPITHNAIPVTRYVSIVTTLAPVTDAVDGDGGRHCWYMIDHEQGLKAMIAERPIESVGSDPFGSNGQPSDAQMSAMAEFVRSVYREAEDSGGIEKLSSRCGNAPS